jgi:hypothetical protein
MSRLTRVRTKDFNLERIQDSIERALSIPDTRVIITTKLLAAGDNVVSHMLGARLVGWSVVDKDAQSDVWKSSSVNPAPDRVLILKCSADVNVALEVF